MHIHPTYPPIPQLQRQHQQTSMSYSHQRSHSHTTLKGDKPARLPVDGNFTHGDGRSRSCSRSTSLSEEHNSSESLLKCTASHGGTGSVVESWHGHGMDMDTDTGVSAAMSLGPPYKSRLHRSRTRWWAGDGYKFDNFDLGMRFGHGACAILLGLSSRVDGVKHYIWASFSDLACFDVSWICFVYSQLDLHWDVLFLPSLSFVFRGGCPLISLEASPVT